IGRRARFRAVLASASVGSSPTSGTTLQNELFPDRGRASRDPVSGHQFVHSDEVPEVARAGQSSRPGMVRQAGCFSRVAQPLGEAWTTGRLRAVLLPGSGAGGPTNARTPAPAGPKGEAAAGVHGGLTAPSPDLLPGPAPECNGRGWSCARSRCTHGR